MLSNQRNVLRKLTHHDLFSQQGNGFVVERMHMHREGVGFSLQHLLI